MRKARPAWFMYVLSMLVEGSHIFLLLSVIDTVNEKICFHIVFNSWKSSDYCEYIKSRYKRSGAIIGNEKNSDPLILDASFQLQVHEDDKNCSIYSSEFCRALYSSLAELPQIFEYLEKLALSDVNNTSVFNKDCEETKKLLQESMQERLPQYFKKVRKPRSSESLILYGIFRRAQISSQFIESICQDSIKSNYEDNDKMQKLEKYFSNISFDKQVK